MPIKPKWNPEWPRQAGLYWFYGLRFRDNAEAQLYVARVHVSAAGDPFYVCEGSFLYKAEGAVGLWALIDLPVNLPYKAFLDQVAANLKPESCDIVTKPRETAKAGS